MEEDNNYHRMSKEEDIMLLKLSKDPLKLFDDIWSGSQMQSVPAFRVDISEDAAAFHIDAELPGLSKEQISLNIEDDVLVIKAERKADVEEHKKDYHRVERMSGSFSRSFNIGEAIDQNAIQADFDNGILHITLAKAAPVKRTKEISIN